MVEIVVRLAILRTVDAPVDEGGARALRGQLGIGVAAGRVGVRAGRIAFDRPAAEVTPQMLDALYAGAEKTSATVIENGFEMRRNLCHFD